MTSCACGGDMVAYGDGLTYCAHCDDGGHELGRCPSCLVYQRVVNRRTQQQ